MSAFTQNCFTRSNPNPLAPAWMFPSEWLAEAPAGYRDEYQLYTLTQTLTASQVITADLKTDTAGNCNFYWRALGVYLYGGAGLPSVRVRDSEGFVFTNTRLALANASPFGFRDHVTPIFVARRMVPGSIVSLDFKENGAAAGVTVLMMFHGVRRWLANDPAGAGRGGAIGVGA